MLSIPLAALTAQNAASRALRGLIAESLSPELFEQNVEAAVALVEVLSMESTLPLTHALGPILRVLGDEATHISSQCFKSASQSLAVIAKSPTLLFNTRNAAAAVCNDSGAVLQRLLKSLEGSDSGASRMACRKACAAVCETVLSVCGIGEKSPHDSDFGMIDPLVPAVLLCTTSLAALFGIEDDDVSSSVVVALAACVRFLERAVATVTSSPSSSRHDSITGVVLEAVRGSSQKQSPYSAVQRGILREFASAALLGQSNMPSPANVAERLQEGEQDASRLQAVLSLCETLTAWMGEKWLLSGAQRALFLRLLMGCVAAQAKVRLDDIEYWFVLADVPSSTASASPPPSKSASHAMRAPNDTTASLAGIDPRFAALPRSRRLTVAAVSYDSHAAALHACWSVLESCVRVLAAASSDDADDLEEASKSQSCSLLSACSPDDLLAMRGTLQDTASFALMAATALWNSDLQSVLPAVLLHPGPVQSRVESPATMRSSPLQSCGSDDSPESLLLRARLAFPVVARAVQYSLAYLQVRSSDTACVMRTLTIGPDFYHHSFPSLCRKIRGHAPMSGSLLCHFLLVSRVVRRSQPVHRSQP
jgi:hypothetical protein